MDKLRGKVIALLVSLIATVGLQGQEENDQLAKAEGTVTIELTRMLVTDVALELDFTIRNDSERDAWVLTDMGRPQLEVFLSTDANTLLVRRRFDVPSRASFALPQTGKYLLFHPGETRAESLAIDLPVKPLFKFAARDPRRPFSGYVRQLRLEVGYYDQELPKLIHDIERESGKFVGTFSADSSIKHQYFRGLDARIAGRSLNANPYVDGYAIIEYSWQAFTREKALAVDVTGISIPYNGPIEYSFPIGQVVNTP